MKYLFATIVFVSFMWIAIFGVFGMHGGMQNHDGGCIAATAQATDCPKQSSPLDYLTFHLNAFKNFSTAIVSDSAASFSAFALLALGIALGAFLTRFALPTRAYRWIKRSDSFKSPSQYALLHWLAFHENSPAAL